MIYVKKILLTLFVLSLTFVFVGFAHAKNPKGYAPEENYPEFGEIKYLGNPSGYHFWFTMEEDLGWYEEGHSYHNVYKFKPKNEPEWCGPVTIPDREPYNLVGPVGAEVWYKIYDVTMDEYVCGME